MTQHSEHYNESRTLKVEASAALRAPENFSSMHTQQHECSQRPHSVPGAFPATQGTTSNAVVFGYLMLQAFAAQRRRMPLPIPIFIS